MAWNDTAAFPIAPLFWNNYVEANPQLLLSYVRVAPNVDGRYYFQQWWNERAAADDLAQFEIDNFYAQMPKYGSLTLLNEWMSQHPSLEETDYKTWAALLHHWNDDAAAWKLLASRSKEPEYPPGTVAEKQESLESKWFAQPDNALNEQTLARVYAATGQEDKEREVIVAVASQQNAPPWFLQKAAFIEAADGHYEEAVTDLLRDDRMTNDE